MLLFLYKLFRIHMVRMFNDQLRNVERAFLDAASGLRRSGYQ